MMTTADPGLEGAAAPEARPSPAWPYQLTIVVPCYNESATIAALLEGVVRLPLDKQVLVIDNKSTDGTRELLLRLIQRESRPAQEQCPELPWARGCEFIAGRNFSLVLQPTNRGKSHSVRIGYALARGRYVICQDADLEYEPQDVVQLVGAAEARNLVAVFGTRFARRTANLPLTVAHAGRVALTEVFNALFAARLTDIATCYKLVRTDVIRRIQCSGTGFELDFELPARLRLAGFEITELPVTYRPRSIADGKKIRWHDGLSALRILLRLRLAARIPEPRQRASGDGSGGGPRP